LITIKQGQEINKSFVQTQKKLDSLKDSINAKQILVDSLDKEIKQIDKKKEEYKIRYEERLKMPTKYQYHDDVWDFTQKMILIGIVVLQFFTIKH
jgi:hypothetical protein